MGRPGGLGAETPPNPTLSPPGVAPRRQAPPAQGRGVGRYRGSPGPSRAAPLPTSSALARAGWRWGLLAGLGHLGVAVWQPPQQAGGSLRDGKKILRPPCFIA